MQSLELQRHLPAAITAPALPEQFPVACILGPSRSSNWPLVEKLCQSSPYYQQSEDGLVFAAFPLQRPLFDAAYEVLRLALGWKSAFFFFRGARVPQVHAWMWIHCYRRSLDAEYLQEHCIQIERRAAFPCRAMRVQCGGSGLYTPEHLTHLAGEMGFSMCPNFNIENYRTA